MGNFVMARLGGAMLVALALVAVLAQARAQQASPTAVIVVVDMTQIMREAKAAKDIQAQIEGAMNAYSREVSQQESGLKDLRDELEHQRTVLAPEVFNAKSQEYQQRYAALDRDVQTKRQEMQQNYSEAMTKVETAALQIVADVAKERKANMVVAKAALLYMDDAFDVTPEVTRRLDQKFPSMPVNLPKPGGAIAAKPSAASPAASK
jgi:Skp family chaperone for outer membrane proteins